MTTGRATSTSDLDLVVVVPTDPEAPYRESFISEGWPVEAFIHNASSIEGFYRLDAASGDCSLAWMVSTGIVILDDDGAATSMRDRARALIDAGPPRSSEEGLRDLRYAVTDLLDDLRGDPSGEESLVVAPLLASEAATLLLTMNGSWRAKGKWLLRRLHESDRDSFDELVHALQAYRRGDADPLVSFAERILDASGGRMFDGYRASGIPLLAAGPEP